MKAWTIKWLTGLSTACALLSVGHYAEGFSASVKAMGMGGAAVAFPQDTLTTVYNPATAAAIGCRWDLGASFYYQHKKLDVSNRGGTGGEQFTGSYKSRNWHFVPELGYNTWFNDCLAFGISLNEHSYIYTRYHTDVPILSGGTGRTHPRFDYHLGMLTATAAYKWDECHAFGVALNWYFGRFKLDGLDRFADFLEVDFFTNMGYNYTDGLGVTFGYYGHWFDCLSVGASISPKVHMHKLHRYNELLANERFDIPLTWSIGLAYEWDPCVTLAADFQMHHFEDTRSWRNCFFSSGEDPESRRPGFCWKNQWMLRLGMNYQWDDCWALRAGYRYESPHFKGHREGTFLNALTNEVVQNYLTLGATYDWDCCSEVSVFAEYGFSHKSHVEAPQLEGLLNRGDLKLHKWSAAVGIAYGQNF